MLGKKVTSILFFAIIFIIPIVTFIMPKKDFSQMENRTLASFPKVSFKALVDRQFMNGFDTYLSDHFVLRDNWVSLKGTAEYIYGKRESNNIFIGENRYIQRLSEPDSNSIERTVDAINNFSERNDIVPFVMIVPSASEIQSEYLPSNAQSTIWSQQQLITSINQMLGSKAVPIDAYKCLYDKRNENIFYRTDHHWTTEGAYYAYVEAGKYLGYQGLNRDLFNIENVSNDFYGTLYSRSAYRSVEPDIIQIYTNDFIDSIGSYTVFDGKEQKKYSSIYFREYLDTKDKYSLFLGPNQPVVTIEKKELFPEKGNADHSNKKNILIFKDSYAQAFVPFLIESYDKITLVDLRYLNTSFEEYVDLNEYSQVLFLYSMDTIITTTDLTKINWEIER